LAYTEVEYCVVTVRDVFKVNKGFPSEIRLVMVSFDSCHRVFIETFHSFWNVHFVIMVVVNVVDEMLEEWLKLVILITSTRPSVLNVIFRGSELRNDINDIV